MKSFLTVEAEPCDETFGSSFDPVLNGVAQALARLFPPIEAATGNEPEGSALWSNDAGDQSTDDETGGLYLS